MAKTHGFHKVVRDNAVTRTLKTANIKGCYYPGSRLWYYNAYNRAFCGPITPKCSYKRAYSVIIFVYQLSYSLYMYSAH
jgi:hypothetical protein